MISLHVTSDSCEKLRYHRMSNPCDNDTVSLFGHFTVRCQSVIYNGRSAPLTVKASPFSVRITPNRLRRIYSNYCGVIRSQLSHRALIRFAEIQDKTINQIAKSCLQSGCTTITFRHYLVYRTILWNDAASHNRALPTRRQMHGDEQRR